MATKLNLIPIFIWSWRYHALFWPINQMSEAKSSDLWKTDSDIYCHQAGVRLKVTKKENYIGDLEL